MQVKPPSRATLVAALLAATIAGAQAHTGAGPTHGLAAGISHPIFGLDHLLAMVAVGLWAFQLGGRAIWVVPAAFVTAMSLAAIAGMSGGQIPAIETGITLSLLVFGVLIAAAIRMPVWAGAAIVGLFAVFHGHAHGSEMPADASGLLYGCGFIVATAALHALGIAFAAFSPKAGALPVVRIAGVAIVAVGAYLAFA